MAAGLAALLLSPLAFVPAAQAEPLRVGLIDSTIYDDAIVAIVKEAGFEAEIIHETVDILREQFVRGELDMDCCSIPEWRTRADEAEVQLFSDHFFVAADHLILGPNVKKPAEGAPLNLEGLRFAAVKGFNYTLDDQIRLRVPVDTIEDAFAALAHGRADVTVFGVQEFFRMQATNPLPVVLGPVTQRYGLRIRVHKDHVDQLPQLNAAIARMKSDGRIDALIGTALRASKAH